MATEIRILDTTIPTHEGSWSGRAKQVVVNGMRAALLAKGERSGESWVQVYLTDMPCVQKYDLGDGRFATERQAIAYVLLVAACHNVEG